MSVSESRFSFVGFGGQQPATRLGSGDVTIAIVPALGLRAAYYRPLAEALSGEQVSVITFDLPGHGDSPVRASYGNDWGYREARDHLRALRSHVRAAPQTGSGRFVWLGHSIGGQLALMDGEEADGVVLVASGTPYFRVWQGLGSLRVLALTQLSAVIASGLGHYPGEQLGFGGREGRTLIRDWARVARTGRYQLAGLDGEGAMERVKAPVHVVRLEGDALAPEAAVEHTLQKLPRARISRSVWPSAEQSPELRRNPHNRWPRTPAFAVQEVRSFLAREGWVGQERRGVES
jgi:predicted alpha/beta hydrolase